jgi:hypothetical protein
MNDNDTSMYATSEFVQLIKIKILHDLLIVLFAFDDDLSGNNAIALNRNKNTNMLAREVSTTEKIIFFPLLRFNRCLRVTRGQLSHK